MSVLDAVMCHCGGKSAINETRTSGNGAKRRRRQCLTCRAKWTTYEIRVDDLALGGPSAPVPVFVQRTKVDALMSSLSMIFDFLALANETTTEPPP